MKELIKSFFSFGIATSLQKIISFLLLPIYTRFFTKVEYGVIDLVQVILGVSSIFAVLQLETAFQRYYYKYKGLVKQVYISTIFIAVVLFSVLVTLVLIIFSGRLSMVIFGSEQYQNVIKVASLQLPFTNFSMLSFVLLRFEKKNKQFVFLILTKAILAFLFIFLFVVWLNKGIIGVFYAQIFSVAISSILLYLSISKFLSIRLSLRLLKKSFRYAYPQIPARIGSVSLSYANRFFMIGYLTISSIGVYALSLKLASSIQLIYSAFIMAWAPFMFEQINKKGHKKIFANVLLLVSGPVFLLVSSLSLFSKEIVLLFGSKEFAESSLYLGSLSLYYALFIIKEIVDIGPKVKEKTQYLTFTFFISVVINLSSLFFFIRFWGLKGVVFSMIFTNVILVSVTWIVSSKLYYVPFEIGKFFVMAVPAFILAIGSMYWTPSFIIKLLIFLVVFLYYGLIFWKLYGVFRTYSPSSIKYFRRPSYKS